MKVSIALCTYNGESFLQEQLNSYATQSVLPFELIVFDDHSTDGTFALLKKYQEVASFPVHIYQNEETIGPAKNFIQSMNACQGEIIMFSDQDDVWMENKVEAFVNSFVENEEAEFIYSNASLINAKGEGIHQDFLDLIKAREKYANRKHLSYVLAREHGFVNGFLLGIRQSLAQKIQVFYQSNPDLSIELGHDHLLAVFASLASNSNAIVQIDEALVKYRQHEQQALGARDVLKEGGEKKVNHTLKKKKEEKTTLYSQFLWYLERYERIIARLPEQKELHKFIEENISFYKQRKEMTEQPFSERLVFSLVNGFSLNYKKFSPHPWKEFVRDLL